MAFDWKEIAVQALLPVIKAVGEAELAQVFATIKANNSAQVYANTLKSIHSNFKLLAEVTAKTKTKIDDGFVDIVLQSVEIAAGADGITL